MANINNIKQYARELNLFNIAKGKVDLNVKYKNNYDYLEDILYQEITCRKENRIKLNKKESNLPNLKFDKKYLIDGVKWQIKKLEKLEFITNDENIFITGKCKTGKTALAVEIANIAIDNDKKVTYITYDNYMKAITMKRDDDKETHDYKQLKNADLIVLDDFLYLDIKDAEIELLYKSLVFFNESRSIIFISNRKVENFIDASTNKHLMTTLIDRIKGNSHIIAL